MEYYAEWRLRGDRYSDGFGNGITLSSGESVREMELLSEEEGLTVFRGRKGHLLKVHHEARQGVTFCRTVLENPTEETAVLELLSSVAIRGLKADRIHRATSWWSAEGKLLSQDLTDLNMEPSWSNHGYRVTRFGQLGSMPVRGWFPFLVLEDSEAGHFVGLQLYCASSWQIEVFRNRPEISVQAGLADRDYGSWWKEIRPGESFESPWAAVAEGSSLQEVCDRLVKAQRPRIAPADQDMPVIFNEWCTTWGNPTLENLERIASRLEGTGVRYLVIDAGWYKSPEYDNWFNAAGDWNPSRELFPEGNIGAAADLIRSHGLIPGIWFEMENVGSEAHAYQDTDLLLSRDGFPVSVGARRFRDMRKRENRDFLDRKMIRLLRENGFGYLKVDYNECIGVGADGAESPGEGLRQAVCASQDYFRHIAEELPELVIENCSSGGHRLEPSMMELVSQASFSDAHEALSIPLIAANLHRLIRPEQSQIWAVLRSDADEHRINFVLTAAFLGRLCLSGDAADLAPERWQQALEAVRLYAQVRHIIRDGFTDTIECTVRDYSRPEGYQIVRRVLGSEALLIVHTYAGGANPPTERWTEGCRVVKHFGSPLDGELRGAVLWLRREKEEPRET